MKTYQGLIQIKSGTYPEIIQGGRVQPLKEGLDFFSYIFNF